MSLPFDDQDGAATDLGSGVASDTVRDPERDRSDFPTLAVRAQEHLNEGRFDAAREVFLEILGVLDEAPSYQRAVAFERVGFCSLMEGQPLVAAGYLQQSSEIVEAIDASDAARALQGIIQSELGQVFSLTGNHDQAREAYEAAIEIARSAGDRRATAIDLDNLGSLNLKQGRIDEAEAQFAEALEIFRECGQAGAQALALHHLGLTAERREQWDDAEQYYSDAARLLVDNRDYVNAANAFAMAAAVCIKSGRHDAAEAWYRNALEHARLGLDPIGLRRILSHFSRLLQRRTDGIAEARELIEEALEAGENSLAPDVWALYGQLAEVVEMQAAAAPDASEVQPLLESAQTYRHICEYGPRLLATLTEIGEEPTFGAAVILERVGRCCLMGGRPAPAVILFRQALAALDVVAEAHATKVLLGSLHSGLGDAYRLAGFPAEAKTSYEASLAVARDIDDARGELVQLTHLGAFAFASNDAAAARQHLRTAVRIARQIGEDDVLVGLEWQLSAVEAGADGAQTGEGEGGAEEGESLPLASRIQESTVIECAFGSDLLIELGREVRVRPLDAENAPAVPDDARPVLTPRVRIAPDDKGTLRVFVPSGEPELLQEQDCIVMLRTEREVVLEERHDVVWRLVRMADGTRSVAGLLKDVAEEDRGAVKGLLAVLVDVGAYDVSGRALAHFVHTATKKGVLAGGGLAGESVLDLASDGGYRSYPDAERIVLAQDVPEAVGPLHALTRARRSLRQYAPDGMSRSDFDALLHTACGITGEASLAEREVKLRAYPSSGALYAVEIYPVVLSVEGLEPGVYHYDAAANALELVVPGLDRTAFIDACLPVEREMVGSAGAMICLAGQFRRHERKYGEGGYRMMVAEAGHISQNLVLSATALGLSARPFGGVFDALINRNLGLDEREEQFLLSVLVGRAP